MLKTKPLKTSEAAALLGVHINTLKRLDIPYFTIGRLRHRRYELADIERYKSQGAPQRPRFPLD